MRIAYFINQYPAVSHSFIRREILELEEQGVEVVRFSVRRNESGLVDNDDLAEAGKTCYLLERGNIHIAKDILTCFISAPGNFLKAVCQMLELARESRVGTIKHIMYLFEACVINRWMKESDVSHVHAHFGTNSTAVTMLAYFLGGVTYSFTVHGPAEFDQPLSLSLGEKIKHARFVVAISSYGKSQLFRWCKYQYWKKIKIVHCALGDDFLKSEVIPIPDATKIICVGRLCEQKGQLLLLESVYQLIKEGVNVELVLAGDGPMRKEIESVIARHQMGSHVKILGWISSVQVRQQIAVSKALVMPSFAEGLPVAIMEALALRRPVITTAIAGIPELVVNGESGWVITAGSIEELTSALRELDAASQTMLNKMGEKAYKNVVKKHNIHTEVKRLKVFFEAV